jgi:8-oxo-dGTP pyrophosphatase MutT (NUDIX family)
MTCCHVNEIDWSDNTIHRAGIIPIVIDEDNNKWIGLCISSYNTSIGTFGGKYENEDYDLLDTAVREFNEEAGNNFSHIKCDDLYDCYAIKTNYSISILVQFTGKPKYFKRTKEIYDMLWVTPDHLRCMYENKDMILCYNGRLTGYPKGFLLSHDLRRNAPIIIDVVTSMSDYNHLNNTPIQRTKRLLTSVRCTDIREHNSFILDVGTEKQWNTSFMVITADNIVIRRYDMTTYSFPRKFLSEIFSVFKSHSNDRFTFIVGDSTNVSEISVLTKPRNVFIMSLEDYVLNSKVSHIIPHEYHESLTRIRNSGDITAELDFLSEYEFLAYREICRLGTYFNPKRAAFLKRVKYVINTPFHSRKDLRNKLRRKFGKSELTPSIFIDIAVRTGIITL